MVRTSGRQIHPRRIRLLVPILVLLAIALYFGLPRTRGDLNRIEGSGTIEATQVSVAPKVAGRVVNLNVREGHTVKPGQVIAELDHDELDAQVAQARAGVAAATSRLALATAMAQRDAVLAQQDAARAQREAAASVSRQAETALTVAVANRRTVSIRQLDVTASRAAVTQAEAALRNAQSATGLVAQRAREVDAARAALAQAQALLELATTSRNNAVLRAPIAGTVLSRNVEVGDLVVAGSPVMTIGDLTSPYLRIFVAETDLGRVKLGQTAEVRVEAFPNRVIRGTVEEISNRAEFTPGNVQTKEARAKLVFGVKIVLPNPDGILKPGLPADAAIIVNSVGASR